jgi:hypothetical protein
MNQSQRTKAKFNAAVRTLRETGRKFNIHDVLADIELAEIAAAKHNGNGDGGEPERVICWCAQGIVNGRRVPVHRPADSEYVAARSALVFEASPIATQRIGDPVGSAAGGYR